MASGIGSIQKKGFFHVEITTPLLEHPAFSSERPGLARMSRHCYLLHRLLSTERSPFLSIGGWWAGKRWTGPCCLQAPSHGSAGRRQESWEYAGSGDGFWSLVTLAENAHCTEVLAMWGSEWASGGKAPSLILLCIRECFSGYSYHPYLYRADNLEVWWNPHLQLYHSSLPAFISFFLDTDYRILWISKHSFRNNTFTMVMYTFNPSTHGAEERGSL